MKISKPLIGALALAAAYAASNAEAQNLSADFVEIKSPIQVNGTVDNGSFIQEYPSGVSLFTQFEAFCVEPLESLSYGQNLIYEIQDPDTLANHAMISRMVGGYLASERTPEDAAAVQWAIWEITDESQFPLSLSLNTGNVRIISPPSAATALLANDYLSRVLTFTPATLVYLTHPQYQNVVTWHPVPEPTSAALAGLTGLLLLRRRR